MIPNGVNLEKKCQMLDICSVHRNPVDYWVASFLHLIQCMNNNVTLPMD